MKKTVVLDFDGVIHSYKSGWKGVDVIPDPPVEGIKDAIKELRQHYKVVVVSTRCYQENGLDSIKAWLEKNDIIVDDVVVHKPPALVYVDDRALTFDGDSKSLLKKIKNFKPWHYR